MDAHKRAWKVCAHSVGRKLCSEIVSDPIEPLIDFTLMTGEVTKLLADVVEALGGEKAKAV